MRRIFDLQAASAYRGIRPLIAENTGTAGGTVLDVGCGAMPYRKLFPKSWTYTGIDADISGTQFDYHEDDVIYYDGVTFPQDSASVDMVFHSEVLEHVCDTKQFLSECCRVLKKDGTMIATVPFQARYHYIPCDYWRFTPSGLKKVLEESGFTDIKTVPRSRDVCVAAYKVLTLGYRLFFSRSWWRTGISVFFAPLWAAGLAVGQISLHLDLGAEEDCLGYVVCCKKKGE